MFTFWNIEAIIAIEIFQSGGISLKKEINIFDYAGHICESMKSGILLTTKDGDFVNAMTIGWGSIGIEWGKPVFIAYVRDSRYTRQILDRTGEFTVNIPVQKADRNIISVCGMKSGREVDKIRELGLTLEEPLNLSVPGIRELPITIECKVIFRNVQDESRLPEVIRNRYYHAINAGDYHIAYYGEIVGAYVIE